jgi:hypothetical protein
MRTPARTRLLSPSPSLAPSLALALVLGGAGPLAGWEGSLPSGVNPSPVSPLPTAAAEEDPQEVLLEIRLGRWVRWTELAWEVDGVPLLPVASFLRHAEIAFHEEEDGGIQGVLHPRGTPFRVTVHGPVRLGSRGLEVDPAHRRVMGGTVHLAVPVLSQLLGVRIDTDWSELTVVVRDPEGLPVGQRRIREERWRGLRAELERPPPTRAELPPRGPLGGFVADWSVATPLDRVVEGSTVGGGVGFRLLGGGTRFTGRSIGPASAGELRLSGSYEVVRPEGAWLRQVGLGDGFGTGPRPRGVRGARLTNAPHVRTSEFGVQSLQGRLGPGWEVELRQQGRVLDVSRADERGAYALDVPVDYGENAVQVVAFGPHGEVLTSEHLLLLSGERLPRGRVEWGVSGGACLDLPCSGTGNADLRVGVSQGWTLRAGVDAFVRDTLPDARHPYLGVAGGVGSALELGGEWVGGGWVRGTATLAPSPHLRIRGAHARFQGDLESPVLFSAGREHTSEVDFFLRPRPRTEHWVVHGSVVHESLGGDRHLRWQARTTFRTGGLRPEARLRGTGTLGPDGAAIWRAFPGASVSGMLPVGTALRPWIRADVEAEGLRGFHQVQLRAGVQAPRRPRVELSTRWHRELGARVALGVTAELRAFRSLTQAFTSGGGRIEATQVTQGTLRWDGAANRLITGPGAGLERGGVSGVVFLDENGNGRPDPGERRLSGVAVTVAGRTFRTDAQGRYESWELTPFNPVRVEVRPESLSDPSWVPAVGPVSTVVPPASHQRLDLAVVPSAEIGGRVVLDGWDGDGPGLAGLTLELQNRSTGAIRELTTFSDGTFYLMGVVPGAYHLGVATQVRERLDLDEDSASISLSIRPEDAGSFLPDLLLRLSPSLPDEPLPRPAGG